MKKKQINKQRQSEKNIQMRWRYFHLSSTLLVPPTILQVFKKFLFSSSNSISLFLLEERFLCIPTSFLLLLLSGANWKRVAHNVNEPMAKVEEEGELEEPNRECSGNPFASMFINNKTYISSSQTFRSCCILMLITDGITWNTLSLLNEYDKLMSLQKCSPSRRSYSKRQR